VNRLYIIGIGGVGKVSKTIVNTSSRLTTDKRTIWFIDDFDKSHFKKGVMLSELFVKDYMHTLRVSLIKKINLSWVAKISRYYDCFQNLIDSVFKESLATMELRRQYASMYESEKTYKDYKISRKMVSTYKNLTIVSIKQEICSILFTHQQMCFDRKQSAAGMKAVQLLMFSVIPRIRCASNSI
jgi:hypothetical protein